ncbi:8-oxo-dGTP pyrophosphatase MutT (NUDIX family) [Actinokineospora baliensis]|uniref:nucleoside 2-deoxyribosyltransferase domain-containing protein n=1 Tax=Actinokineospora baliensis TaxID=547056 RepID=UPI00195D0428|nr:nucleoside 2-deoxyribosyltransferase domain-containing protein [Actinokineospora baliensis]MBM7775370.1 8-oxo-dGTP pyrophosphatase MutT (NUDIX family) [Actinokineospora baliensis]
MRRVVVVRAGEEPPEAWSASVFLAGPTPRSPEVPSWRPAAVAELEARWSGSGTLVVFVPEPLDGVWPDYTDQRTWELRWGDRCDVVLFWIPRGPGMPALTTNDEFGRWKDSGRVVLGTPPEAESVRYQRGYAADNGIPTADTLTGTIDLALAELSDGVEREGGRRFVPLRLWRTEGFRRWVVTVERSGNDLVDATQLWVFPTAGPVVFWALRVSMWVAAEDRLKVGEVVLSRPDLASVVAYLPGDTPHDTEVVLVREFRPAARTMDGFVLELPGGSHSSVLEPVALAALEFGEETGLTIAANRLVAHTSRQLAATMTTHRQAVFSVRLTAAEMDGLRGAAPVVDGTEVTYPVVWRVGDLFADGRADWTTLGAVAEVLLGS